MKTSVLILLLTFGCKNIQNEFKDYFSLIPVLQYPIVIDCLDEFDYFDIRELHNPLIDKYLPENCAVNGRINVSENYIAIIYSYPGDSMYPSIYTFTINGVSIDTLNLGSFCGEWHGTINRRIIKINDNKGISVIDSVKYYLTDENEDILWGTDSIIVENINYELDERGHFQKTSEDKKIINNRHQ